jgi:hypothetical protein
MMDYDDKDLAIPFHISKRLREYSSWPDLRQFETMRRHANNMDGYANSAHNAMANLTDDIREAKEMVRLSTWCQTGKIHDRLVTMQTRTELAYELIEWIRAGRISVSRLLEEQKHFVLR